VPERELIDVGSRVAQESLSVEVYPEVRAMIRAHQKKGHTVAIVSSATRYQIESLARSFGITDILCTELEVLRGKLTGRPRGPICYGEQKVVAARAFARRRRISLKKSFFYSNGVEDSPLLEVVGHPVLINPDSKLAAKARKTGWPAFELDSRGSVGVGDIARTLLIFGSTLPFLAASLPIRALGGSQRDATNAAIAAWTDVAAIIAGLKLIVEGEENLWAERPAVFIFNHRSAVDLLITAKLLRHDAVGVAKQELKWQALVGPALNYTGAIFVDRDHIDDPEQALRPALDALHDGRSVVMAPEGTRSRTGRLGRFRNGAFHLARQAGVPIVPIIIYNADDALPVYGKVIRPAEVKVRVLKPVSTRNWRLRDVAVQAKRIRDIYLHELDEAVGAT
jgi:putative phosphoserine phosphatase/1-acylglycerol-3-phosphate O-acyltransferase